MNKRLLISFAAIMGAMTSFAYNVGDYVYTHDAKFKVVGKNLIANGNFASNYDGWKDYGSEEKYWGFFFCFIVFCIFALSTCLNN